jgi:hypothetical protein
VADSDEYADEEESDRSHHVRRGDTDREEASTERRQQRRWRHEGLDRPPEGRGHGRGWATGAQEASGGRSALLVGVADLRQPVRVATFVVAGVSPHDYPIIVRKGLKN